MAIAAVAAFNVNLNTNQKSELSLLALANVEALANGESGGTKLSCYQTISNLGNGRQTHVTYCGSCTAQLARDWNTSSHCYQ